MSLPDQTPKLPKLPFLVGDAALLGVAWFLVYQATTPLSTNIIIAVIACVAIAGLLGAIPFFADYARRQDEALDDRQRGLEALARTTTTAAEQISIAANGLNELSELLHRNLKQAEQLPHKLQEKIAEFNAQLENAREDEREELEKEVAELRSSETERLQAVADRVHKAVAELTKLEAAAQKHLSERTDLVERTNAVIAKTQGEATASLQAAAAGLSRELAAAQAKALAETEARLAAATAASITTLESALAAATTTAAAQLATISPHPTAAPAPAEGSATTSHSSGAELAAPPKRPRKSRREEPAPTETSSPAATEPLAAPSLPTENAGAPTSTEPGHPIPPAEPTSESLPTAEISPATPEPMPGEDPAPAAESPTEPPVVTPEPPPAEQASEPPVERPARKRRKSAPDESADLTLELGGGEFLSPTSDETPVTTSEVIERVISSDGATRLIATAYIGIGNRLFIRGDGPGLSWEKGVPLQFVSIGKWRWETADATAPIQIKLYKNDELECSALGTLTLEPGHQQEVTAKF